MKKKLISFALILALMFTLCVSAFAAAPGMSNFKANAVYTSSTFKDVPGSAWYATSVKLCYEYGLMNGKGAARFDPTGSLTLAEAVVMADQVNAVYNTGSALKLSGTPWYQPYVEYAVTNGIIKDGDFTNYAVTATRAQMAYIFANALPASEYSELAAVASIPDVQSGDQYASDIYKLYNAGILAGSDRYGNFKPTTNIKRCEAAAILSRVALTGQRNPTVLFKDFSEGVVKFSMPVSSVRSSDSGLVMYEYSEITGKYININYNSETDAAYSGYSITDLPMAQFKKSLSDEFTAEGMTASFTSGKTVKFGSVAAYRFDVNVTMDGTTVPEIMYGFIIGSTMYSVVVSSLNAQMRSTVDASITVNGYSAK